MRASRTAALAATLLAVGAVRAQAPVRADADPIAAAEAAWGRGDFPAALRTLRAALHGPEARRAGGPAGHAIAVKAVNARGLDGWDWARTVAP